MLTRELRSLFEYSDWANARVVEAAERVPDDALDRPLDLGPGSLRRILIHTYNGEHVWLQRWKGVQETKWPSESEAVPVLEIARRFTANSAARAAFFEKLAAADLERGQQYRDSKGSVFAATLGDMILQGHVHSVHHRAQAVNALRRLGGPIVELDYMMRVRRPAAG